MSTSTQPPKLHDWQQPAGHTVFPASEWPLQLSTVYIYAIATLGDSANYCYVVVDKETGKSALVDPAEPSVVLSTLQRISQYHSSTFKQQLSVSHILTTHKHWDHAGGNYELYNHYKQQSAPIQVVGGKIDNVEACTLPVSGGDTVQLGSSTVHVHDAPCHTRGHVLYTVANAVITGDTMFSAGCGKFFEGNAEQMYANLYETIGRMADDTLVLPGHEYTQSNMEYVAWLEPNNADIQHNLQYARERRQHKLPVIPTELAYERKINSFMRVHDSTVSARILEIKGVSSSDLPSDSKQRGIQLLQFVRAFKDENRHKQSKM